MLHNSPYSVPIGRPLQKHFHMSLKEQIEVEHPCLLQHPPRQNKIYLEARILMNVARTQNKQSCRTRKVSLASGKDQSTSYPTSYCRCRLRYCSICLHIEYSDLRRWMELVRPA